MDNETKVITARSIEEVERLRDAWKAFYPFPVAGINYFLAVLQNRPTVERPHVILISKGEEFELLAVGRIENVFKYGEIAGRKIYRSKVKRLFFDIGCVVGNLSEENCKTAIIEIICALRGKEADLAFFSEIPTSSHLYRLSKAIPGRLFCDYFPEIQGHYKMTLPDSAELFYRARKKAKNLRRIANRIHREFNGKVGIKCYRERSDVEKLCRDAEKISRNTYQYAAGAGLDSSAETVRRLSVLADLGQLIAFVLYINDEPCAFEGGIYFEKTYFADYCGYVPKYKKYEIGTFLELKIIEALCGDPRFEYLDFGWMDTFHKNRYCDIVQEEATIEIYQPSINGFIRNLKKISYHVGKALINRSLNTFRGWSKR